MEVNDHPDSIVWLGVQSSMIGRKEFLLLAWRMENLLYGTRKRLLMAMSEYWYHYTEDARSRASNDRSSDALIMRSTPHKGPVRGLDFNPIQTNLLASGGVAGEVFIWDVKDPSKPYAPTTQKTTKLDEITSVAWNQQVQYVLAGASTTGYTVVWDLRGKREVVSLAYGGGAGTQAGQMNLSGSMAVGGRRGMSDIAWHPDNVSNIYLRLVCWR